MVNNRFNVLLELLALIFSLCQGFFSCLRLKYLLIEFKQFALQFLFELYCILVLLYNWLCTCSLAVLFLHVEFIIKNILYLSKPLSCCPFILLLCSCYFTFCIYLVDTHFVIFYEIFEQVFSIFNDKTIGKILVEISGLPLKLFVCDWRLLDQRERLLSVLKFFHFI